MKANCHILLGKIEEFALTRDGRRIVARASHSVLILRLSDGTILHRLRHGIVNKILAFFQILIEIL